MLRTYVTQQDEFRQQTRSRITVSPMKLKVLKMILEPDNFTGNRRWDMVYAINIVIQRLPPCVGWLQ